MKPVTRLTPFTDLQVAAPVEPASRANLEQAFAVFNQMSSQLSDSYNLLETQVAELNGQLAQVSAQRIQELAEKERLAQRLQSLLDLLPGGVIVLDGQGVVRDANPAACGFLGLPLVGMLWRLVIARNFAPREDDGHEISLKDGRRLAMATRSLNGEPGQLILLTDLTETRRLQEQLSRHERLSALGRMVASLAHQIRDMLVFARGELPLPDRLTPKALFDALRSAAEAHVQERAVRWQCDSHSGELLCNRDTLVGALMNLVENALQAAGPASRLKVHLYSRGSSLRLCISDNGSGIDSAILARLGEPFFTTKTTGTGLGLAVVQAVARAHQGNLQLRSTVARGTCAILTLPLIHAGTSCDRGVTNHAG